MSVGQINKTQPINEEDLRGNRGIRHGLIVGFVKVGILPPLLLLTILFFAVTTDNFLTLDNLHAALRQNSFFIIATMAQLLVLLSGGFDLSIGSLTALVSVNSALVMAAQPADQPAVITVTIGVVAGLGVGLLAGMVNALGVSVFKVNPFIMTLATGSIFAGLALRQTSGVPVYGMPAEFADWLGFNNFLGIGVAIWIALGAAILLWFFLIRTRPGRHIYAVGASPKAARLSGIGETRTLFLVYSAAGVIAAIGAVLLTARLGTGEATIGASLPLETIAAAVIGGVSLRGGQGGVLNAVLGAIFIGLVVNGMNLAQVASYNQMIVTGVVLAFAVVADRIRQRMATALLAGRK